MLNEPRSGGDTPGGEGAAGQGSPQTNYIQVTPQEKEAIERVGTRESLVCLSVSFCRSVCRSDGRSVCLSDCLPVIASL